MSILVQYQTWSALSSLSGAVSISRSQPCASAKRKTQKAGQSIFGTFDLCGMPGLDLKGEINSEQVLVEKRLYF